MGLFDIFNKKKAIDWTAKSISELESVINAKDYPSDDDRQFCIMNYVHKIIEMPKSQGGFGGSKEYISSPMILASLKSSIEKWGIHVKRFPNGRSVINNFVLEFVKNYIEHNFPKPINSYCLKKITATLLGECSDDEEERHDAVSLKILIEQSNGDLYTRGLYEKYGDYKFFIALQLQDEDFHKEFPVFRRNSDGSFSNERLSVADIADLDAEDVEAFIGDCIDSSKK